MQLIMIEGLPGTGKTSIAQWLREYLFDQIKDVTLLLEGNAEIPCDFYEMAGIPNSEVIVLSRVIPDIYEMLHRQAVITENYTYLRIDECPEAIAEKLRRWDMGDEKNQRITVADYVPCALERLNYWVKQVESKTGTVIVDSGFLQNPINELLFRKAEPIEVHSFVLEIFKCVKVLNPICIYLDRESAEEAIDFACKVKGTDWTNRVTNLLRETGCENLFSERYKLEQELLPQVTHLICNPIGNDWSIVKKHIIDYLSM